MRRPKLATTKKTDRKRFDEKKKKASAYHQEKKADGKDGRGRQEATMTTTMNRKGASFKPADSPRVTFGTS
jgi:hypothetical protein